MRSKLELDLVHAGCRPSASLGRCQFAVGQGGRVIAARVEVGELIDPVEHIRNQLLEKDAGSDPNLAAQFASDGASELREVRVVDRKSTRLNSSHVKTS